MVKLSNGVFFCLFVHLTLEAQINTTYYKDILPVFKKNCLQCHKKNGIAPIAFESHKDIAKSSLLIKKVIESGYMPPWKPDTNYVHYLNERILSSNDKHLILQWIDNKCPIGTSSEEPLISQEKKKSNTQNALVAVLPFKVHIQASPRDTNVMVEIPYEIEKDTFVSSYEFILGRKKAVHHVSFYVHDLSIPEPIISQFEGKFFDGKKWITRTPATNSLAIAGGWAQGSLPLTTIRGTGYFLPKKGVIALDIHYGPSAVSFDDQFSLKFTYADSAVERIVALKLFGHGGGICEPVPFLSIPPDSVMHFSLKAEIPHDISLFAISGHMHLLGRIVTAWIVNPKGDTIPLLKINDWDFNWQEDYYFTHLVKIERGSMFYADVVMDNTSNNIRNPNNPPKRIEVGLKTSDEMIQIRMYMLPYKDGDEKIILHK